jgi:hypothetical protein
VRKAITAQTGYWQKSGLPVSARFMAPARRRPAHEITAVCDDERRSGAPPANSYRVAAKVIGISALSASSTLNR